MDTLEGSIHRTYIPAAVHILRGLLFALLYLSPELPYLQLLTPRSRHTSFRPGALSIWRRRGRAACRIQIDAHCSCRRDEFGKATNQPRVFVGKSAGR